MKLIMCECCGADDLQEKDGLIVCNYCGSKFKKPASSTIALNDDIQRLLDKCKKEPGNARKYANLILDIDPTNKEALEYL